MSKNVHKIYLLLLTIIVLLALVVIVYKGFTYYETGIEDRFFHPKHADLKPSGYTGHGLGIFGSLAMIIGISLYMVRKRNRAFSRLGVLKHWLEFHIFLCTLGPIMVLFHTAFKFGGIVAISFWSMVAVFLSGIVGRFIYIQIPRTIEGRELSLSEVRDMKTDIGLLIKDSIQLDKESYDIIVDSVKKKIELYHKFLLVRFIRKYRDDLKTIRKVKAVLKKNKVAKVMKNKVLRLVKNDISLNRRIERLVTMQNLFKYWHVAHLPFAIVMLVIMIIHVAVTLVFGYRWIF
ncbi:MAG TPA: hypothetical protein DCG75_03515 [Bacteroidales bacterium]|jgi:hypothetical protein|nr:hypothetical protein [Bacteroidales bacterium]